VSQADQPASAANSTDRFFAELWSGIEGTYQAILEHTFITGLTDGSLERVAFEFYVVQDAHYLREYARALSVAAARAPAEADIAMFNEHAAGAIAVERSLHEGFFADLGISEGERRAYPGRPDEPRLHQLPDRHRLRRLLRRAARGGPRALAAGQPDREPDVVPAQAMSLSGAQRHRVNRGERARITDARSAYGAVREAFASQWAPKKRPPAAPVVRHRPSGTTTAPRRTLARRPTLKRVDPDGGGAPGG